MKKVSDYIAEFLVRQGIRNVFVVAGGASLHLIDSIDNNPEINFTCPMHEQGAAMAADAYSRVTGNLGAAISTSGPGATNMLTGVCSAFYDSIPVLYITGQVSTTRLKGDTGVRQIGFQETDTVKIYKSVTKYAVQIQDAKDIRFELEKCCYIAKSGRPGPVVIDIPDNIQRENIDPEKIRSFTPQPKRQDDPQISADFNLCKNLLKEAVRPIIILGWGIRLAKAEREIRDLVDHLSFPVAPTWAVADMFPWDDPLYVGTFGTHGTRYANFAIQNADLVLSIGSRLDTKATGSPISSFAREAKKIVVDIDPFELNKFDKFGLKIDLKINMDAMDFIVGLKKELVDIKMKDISEWKKQIYTWKEKYPICPEEYRSQKSLNPYCFVKMLSQQCAEDEIIISDTGCTLAWMMQAFEFKKNQRIFHDWNNTAMGWALPASLGAFLADSERKRIICVIGDGSLMMTIQELATIDKLKLPIKIFVFNNHGYSMIKQTQDQWLQSRYCASSGEGGLALPDFQKIASAFNMTSISMTKNSEIAEGIRKVLDHEGPSLCNIDIDAGMRVIPQVKFGRPNEDSDPLLTREEFLGNMIVKPLDISMKC
jgi:acetolactate synthase I/II/III large subunit